MRFLLFPRTRKSSTSEVFSVSSRVVRRTKEKIHERPSQQNPLPNSSSKLASQSKGRFAESSNTSSTSPVRKIWGQQCSENCGCVVRFQADIDSKSGSVVNINYSAKSVLSMIDPDTKQRSVARTTKGRPMLKECSCTTLHTLSQEIVHEIAKNPKWNHLYSNIGNFETTRSSLAFRQAVLTTHKLPSKDTHCFDVVEEAITAMIKGYMPQGRKLLNHTLPKHQYYTYGNQDRDSKIHDDDDDNDDTYDNKNEDEEYYDHQQHLQYHGSNNTTQLPFGNIFREISEPSILSISSTLSMYDRVLMKQQDDDHERQQKARQEQIQQQPQQREKTHRGGTLSVKDWVSYVDQQYYYQERSEDEKSSA